VATSFSLFRAVVIASAFVSTLAAAAINPAEFTRRAPYQLQLRPTAQIVEHFERDGEHWRRTTIVAEVVAEHVDTDYITVGETVVIDWSVNLTAQKRARDAHDREPPRPGPQFMYDPEPPTPDARGLIWAHLRADDSATLGLPDAAKDPATAADADRRVGHLLVPAASQYTFSAPMD
jgi:hypothetical protein